MLNVTNLSKTSTVYLGIIMAGISTIATAITFSLDLNATATLQSLAVVFLFNVGGVLFVLHHIRRCLRQHTQILGQVLDQINDVIVIKDFAGNFVYCNEVVGKLYNADPRDMVGKDDFYYTQNREQADFFKQNVQSIMTKMEKEEVFESSTDAVTGEIKHFHSIKIPFIDAQQQKRIMVIAKDVTEITQLKEEADRNKRRLEHVLDVSEEGLWEWHVQTNQVLHNDRWEAITQVERSENTFAEFENKVLPDDLPLIHNALTALLENNQPYNIEFRMRLDDGRIIWIWDRGQVSEFDEEGNPKLVVGIILDITEQKQDKEKIVRLAFYDQLTGLINRAEMEGRLQSAMTQSQHSKHYNAVLFLDLDRFKLLNDSYGHHMGDKLLIEVAQRLKAIDICEHVISRFGGDEFVILLPALGSNKVESFALAEKYAQAVISSISEVHYLCSDMQDVELKYSITGSIGGIVFANSDLIAGKLIQLADMALYRAKAAGGNNVLLFNTDMQDELTKSSELQRDMNQSIADQDFVIHLQPKLNRDKQIIGAEALVRWEHPTKGLVGPYDFIALAEESNLIIAIGYQVLQRACEQLERWQAEPASAHLTIAVNLSAKQIWQSYFVEEFIAVTEQYNINRENLIVEVTESVLIQDLNDATTKLSQLKEFGVTISLDDIGTGYSSMSYLRSLPIDELKIDHSFVKDINHDAQAYLVVKSIIDLARNFNLKIVAEGVEEEAQFSMLNEYNVDTYQGFFFSKPISESAFIEVLKENQRAYPLPPREQHQQVLYSLRNESLESF